MNINIPQTYFSKLMRAVVEFELIEQGDRILIGVSGGKDSIFLTYALAILRERLKKDFTIAAFTVNPQFDDPFDTDAIASFCKQLDVPYEVVDVDIAGAIAEQDDTKPLIPAHTPKAGLLRFFFTTCDDTVDVVYHRYHALFAATMRACPLRGHTPYGWRISPLSRVISRICPSVRARTASPASW